MNDKQKSNFSVGDEVTSTYIDAIGHSSTISGVIHRGPIEGEHDTYWYVKLGGVAVLFPEKDLSHAQG